MADLLADVARRLGGGPLLRALGEAAVKRAMGPFLARRVRSFRIDGNAWVLEVADAATVADVQRLSAEILAGVRRSGARPPSRLVVRASAPGLGPGAAARAPGRPKEAHPVGPLASEALDRLGDEGLRARLARVIGHAPSVAPERGSG